MPVLGRIPKNRGMPFALSSAICLVMRSPNWGTHVS